MKITVLCVGKIKETFYRATLAEYEKRLGRYCKLEILEVPDEKTPDRAGEALEEQIRAKEARRLLPKIREDALVCALEITGERYSSEGFAALIEQAQTGGTGQVIFIIGGSLGLHPSVRERSGRTVSFSDLTFPHQLMRVILCEQLYRAYRMIHGEPYHK
jgi:23S rRNA (pseudouridine1915-N3)-methyltransferase